MSERDERELDSRAPRRILVPVDALRGAVLHCALPTAAALVSALDAELVLLGVSELAEPPGPTAPALGLEPGSDHQELLDALARERLKDAESWVPAGVRSRSILCWGPAGAAIVDAVQDEAADLVVLPMRRGGALSHVLHDGVDRHVLHHCPVPVLVVPTS